MALSVVSCFSSSNLALADSTGAPAAIDKPDSVLNKPKREFSITAAVPNHPRQVVKFGKHFILFDESGMAPANTPYGYGLYSDDTRYLSTWNVKINGAPLTLLSANTDDGYAARYTYANGESGKTVGDVPGQIALVERQTLIDDCFREHYKVTNYDVAPRTFMLEIDFAADFADMFEVRGSKRAKRGDEAEPLINPLGQEVMLSYRGLDNQEMKTFIGFSQAPLMLTGDSAKFQVVLQPHQSWEVDTAVATNSNEPKVKLFDPSISFADRKKIADDAYAKWRQEGASIVTDNETFNRWLEKSNRDLYILRQPTPRGECIAAGVPWFSVAFGRDQEITALETLPFRPQLARLVLNVLSAYQGTTDNKLQEEHPGRIMHELRLGEMARLKEIPFIPYYGTVDATPLYVVLMDRYLRATNDVDFVKAHWQNVQSALGYLESQAQGGYLRYGGEPGAALANQGWKDSGDSIMYENGEMPKPPIALCEAQGYLYSAYLSAAHIAQRLNQADDSTKWQANAEALKGKFQKDFWSEKLGYVDLALDGNGAPCEVVSSNPGHLLSTGILNPEQEARVADRIMQDDMYSGWGVRTLSTKAVRYNPFSYHDGSVWPHDNAIVAYGLSAADRTDSACRILDSMFKVAECQPNLRLPELFCGFPSTFAEKPLWYPVSCAPQAWAAGSPFLMLQAALGLTIDEHSVRVHNPHLPDSVNRLELHNLPVADGRADIILRRENGHTLCEITPSSGITADVKLDQASQ
jgi:glycogen debranching enzyme